MKTTLLSSLAVLTALAGTTTVWGQTYATRTTNNGTPVIQRHASTYEEGVLRGAADVVRAAGDYNYNTSLALINREEARRRFFENRERWVQTYFNMRRMNREARVSERGPRVTQEDAERISRLKAPKRLGSHQFEQALSKLYWPKALQGPRFAQVRAEIDQLVANRTAFPAHTDRVKDLAGSLKDGLKSEIGTMSAKDYIAAKQFLTGLEVEMNRVPTGGSVAAR